MPETHYLPAEVLPDDYEPFPRDDQRLSQQLDEQVVKLLVRIGKWNRPEQAFGMDTYLRVQVSSEVLERLRVERRRQGKTVFVRGYPVEARYRQDGTETDVFEVSCDQASGWGHLAPTTLDAAAAEVYTTLRRDGAGVAEAHQMAGLLAPQETPR